VRRVLPIALLLAVAGCAHRGGGAAQASAGPDRRAFVYGVVEVPSAVGPVACVALIEADHEPATGARHGCVPATADGLFWAEDVAPIRWAVDGVVAGGELRRFTAAVVAVAPGSLQDWGVFRLEPSEAGAGRLVPASRPTRAEVLQRLLEQKGIAERWKERIAARLAAGGD
jgi:hypothetical protein